MARGLGVGFTLFAVAFALLRIPQYRGQDETLRWSSTEGVVDRAASHDRGSTRRGTSRGNALDLAYTYRVNGATHQGDQWYYDDNVVDDENVKRVLASLAPGTRVTVWHDPNDATRAVLMTGRSPYAMSRPMAFVFGGGFLAIGVFVIVMAIGTRNDPPETQNDSMGQPRRARFSFRFGAGSS